MQPDGSKHSSFSVPNNRNGAKLIVDRVTSVLQSLDIPQVVIGMEATSVYGDNLMRFFRESGSLGRFDRRLHMLNPKQVKKYDKAIEMQLQTIPQTLTSVKGIGNVYAAGIIAEIGDINRFPGQASVAKYAGLVWTQHQSGDFDADDKRLVKSGNHHLRYYLCEAANALRRCDPEFKRFYDLKYKEVTKHNHKRALALTARKLVRLVYSLLKTNRLYIPPEEY